MESLNSVDCMNFCVVQQAEDGILAYNLHTGFGSDYIYYIEYKMEEFVYKAKVFIYVYYMCYSSILLDG